MAAIFTLLSASPYSMKYEYTYDGVGDPDATVTKAQMLADFDSKLPLPPSPLRALLAKTEGFPAWLQLGFDAVLSLYVIPSSNPPTMLPTPRFTLDAGEVFRAFGIQDTGMSAIIEIRFNHTFER